MLANAQIIIKFKENSPAITPPKKLPKYPKEVKIPSICPRNLTGDALLAKLCKIGSFRQKAIKNAITLI